MSIPTDATAESGPTAATANSESCAIEPTKPFGHLGAPLGVRGSSRSEQPRPLKRVRATILALPLARLPVRSVRAGASGPALIKALGETFKGVTGISGGAILGDGRVGLILDVDRLFKERNQWP